jgi:very-short-patch-repair endonuclease
VRIVRLAVMKPEDALHRLGGVADARAVARLTSRARLRGALARGSVVRDGRGRYALPTANDALRAANRLTAVASHDSAAVIHGWETKHPPAEPTVTVPRQRKVSESRRQGVRVKWSDLPPEQVDGHVTTVGRTVMDCAKDMPFDEALAIADSALRHGHITPEQLAGVAASMPVRHRERCLRVVREADGRAANPFESVLRAISLDVPTIRLVPQQVVIAERNVVVRPDLVDVERRVVAEADSFAWHGSRKALSRDCRRYNVLTLRGWTVLRFSWEDVMYAPEYVRDCLTLAAAGRRPQRHAVTTSAGRATA